MKKVIVIVCLLVFILASSSAQEKKFSINLYTPYEEIIGLLLINELFSFFDNQDYSLIFPIYVPFQMSWYISKKITIQTGLSSLILVDITENELGFVVYPLLGVTYYFIDDFILSPYIFANLDVPIYILDGEYFRNEIRGSIGLGTDFYLSTNNALFGNAFIRIKNSSSDTLLWGFNLGYKYCFRRK